VSNDPFERIIGQSRAAHAIRVFGRRAASVDAPVLVLGESGTGKGVLARAIHEASPRAKAPFVAVNCAAIPEALFESEFFGHVRGAFTGAQYAHRGLFEQAHGGTLFLDEIGELPMIAQAKLLTAIEDRLVRKVGAERTSQVDMRVVSATACDHAVAVASGRFREDLFHRLSVLSFVIPPLRDRREDIEILTRHMLDAASARYRRTPPALPDETIEILKHHHWPGNVRELANVIERALLNSTNGTLHGRSISFVTRAVVTPSRHALAPQARYSFAGDDDAERRAIEDALAACHGNKTHAARMLGMSRNTLLNKLRDRARAAGG
jgi:transcriptional regulator with PAS, ATPase and Fis domain